MNRLHLQRAPRVSRLADELVLVVGMERGSLPDFTGGLQRAHCEYLPFTLIHAALSCAPFANHVVSPLVADHFDAMDLAHELHRAEFSGTYSVVIPPLPRPEIIVQELRQICPGLTVNLYALAPH